MKFFFCLITGCLFFLPPAFGQGRDKTGIEVVVDGQTFRSLKEYKAWIARQEEMARQEAAARAMAEAQARNKPAIEPAAYRNPNLSVAVDENGWKTFIVTPKDQAPVREPEQQVVSQPVTNKAPAPEKTVDDDPGRDARRAVAGIKPSFDRIKQDFEERKKPPESAVKVTNRKELEQQLQSALDGAEGPIFAVSDGRHFRLFALTNEAAGIKQ